MTTEHRVLPDGVQPCVWMSAGVIAYWLCDRQLDCERCLLFAALRRVPGAAPALAPPRPHAGWIFPNDRRYGTSHLWHLAVAPNRVRLGIDAFAATLLATVRRVELPPVNTQLLAGQPACWLDAHAGSVALKMPAPGGVVVTNPDVVSDPELTVVDPYQSGWLFEVVPPLGPLAKTPGLLSAAEMEASARFDLRRLQRQLALELLSGAEGSGPAMADTGEGFTDLRHVLGHERYRKLIADALG